jgi:hypothetical protein
MVDLRVLEAPVVAVVARQGLRRVLLALQILVVAAAVVEINLVVLAARAVTVVPVL